MSITIKRNKKPDLPVCIMVCDKKIHPKLDKYELTTFFKLSFYESIDRQTRKRKDKFNISDYEKHY